VVSGDICVANGSISFVLTRRLPLVSSLARAICDIDLDATDRRLDCEHYSHLRHVALAHTWTSVGAASSLGNAAGIRMRGDSCHIYRFAPEDEPTYNAQRTDRVKPNALVTICVCRSFVGFPTFVLSSQADGKDRAVGRVSSRAKLLCGSATRHDRYQGIDRYFRPIHVYSLRANYHAL
jgi:hypothetical protein